MHRAALATILAAWFASGCEIPGARAQAKPERGPAVLFVRPALLGEEAGPGTDGSEARPFRSLRAALAAAPAGALLRLDDGVFRENVTLARPVVLMGRGAGRTRIVAANPRGVVLEAHAVDRIEIYGLTIEGGAICAGFAGGSHRLQRVELHRCAQAGLLGRGADIELISSVVSDVSGGHDGRGVDLDGGSLEARKVSFYGAGRRAVVLNGARGTLEDVEVHSSGLSGLQATSGADARVIRGVYDGLGGAALYAGGSKLAVEGARVSRSEYGVLGFRGAVVTVQGGELSDYRVAGVAMVNSHGSVENVTIVRGGTDAAISITRASGPKPVLLLDNRISHPGTMGVHVTESTVTARGNTITGARLDAEKDMGDAFYAVDSRLVIEQNVMRGNAGSGVAAVRTQVRLTGNGFIENGRAGVLLLDGSKGSANGNTFERNVKAGVELGEQARATLTHNRFGGPATLDIDTWCGKGLAGKAEIGEGNLALAGLLRQRSCGE